MSTLFISDLHLSISDPDGFTALLSFLRRRACHAERLFVLGDLFDTWLGDDFDQREPAHGNAATGSRPAIGWISNDRDGPRFPAEVAGAFKEVADQGTELFLMHGNRDFLLGDDYARRCGATLIDQPAVIATAAGPALILHGDQLCTDDRDYQAFRAQVRSPQWQAQFLAQTREERARFAHQARARSKVDTRRKADEIMDVNPTAVLELLQTLQQRVMIHGHTHRPADHPLAFPDGSRGRRIVLSDWDGRPIHYATADERGFSLRTF